MLALPLVVAACTSEEEILTEKTNNQYANIPTVEAGFNWGADTRMNTEWKLEEGDKVGLAWLGVPDDTYSGVKLDITGNAYQNHPLYATADKTLMPQTSIYVGKYFSYLPYDEGTVSIDEIKFSIAKQELLDEYAYTDGNYAYNQAAKKSIWISPKWTNVTPGGDPMTGNNQAGVGKTFNIYPRQFTNKAALNLNYVNNKPVDVEGNEIGEVRIDTIKVMYAKSTASTTPVSVNAFSYAPTEEIYNSLTDDNDMDGQYYWYKHSFKSDDLTASGSKYGFCENLTSGEILLINEEGVATTNGDNKGKFYYNALPSIGGDLTGNDYVVITIACTYGTITYQKKISEAAKTINIATDKYMDGYDGTDETDGLIAIQMKNSFVNKLYVTGNFTADVDFADVDMNGMHVIDDTHLKQLLKFFQNYCTTQTGVVLNLDPTDGEFDLSLESIELLQTINAGVSEDAKRISIQACTSHGNPKVVIYGNEDEVPNLDKCFNTTTEVTLRGNWNWDNEAAKTRNNVTKIYNEGSIEVNTKNVEVTPTYSGFEFRNNGTINVNTVANWKVPTTNYGTITIAEDAELRVYGTTLTNDATSLEDYGKIYNSGVLGVVAGTTSPAINNYGYIKNNLNAKTYVTTNQYGTGFAVEFNRTSNKIGTIELTTATDNVSVNNATNTGFIKYTWDDAANEDGKYVTPSVDVKYNYLIVTKDIELVDAAPEIQYIEIAGDKEVVITCKETSAFHTTRTQGSATIDDRIGFILKAGQKANIKEGNILWTKGAFLKGTLYLGGEFKYNLTLVTYFGGSTADQKNIIKY